MLEEAKKWFLQWPSYLLLVACFSRWRWTLPMLLGEAWMKTWFCTEKSVAFSAGQKSKLTLGAAFWTFLGTKNYGNFREVGVWYAWNAWLGLGWDVWLGEISHCFSTLSWWKGNLNSLKHRKPVALKIFEGRIFCPFFQTGGVRKPHIIALDEPTNYIDMETLDALVQGLARYKGGIIVARWEETTAGFGRITSKVWVCLCMIVVLFIVYYGNYIVDYIWYIRYICNTHWKMNLCVLFQPCKVIVCLDW